MRGKHNPGINPELLKSSLVKHNTNLLHDVCKVLFFRKCAASTISEKTELLFRTNTISEKTELPNNPNIESQFGTIMIFKHGRKVNFARFKFERRSKSWKKHKPQIFQIYLPFSKISIAAQFMGSTGSTGPTTHFEACPSPSAGPTNQLKLTVASTPDGRLMNGGTPACRFNARVGKKGIITATSSSLNARRMAPHQTNNQPTTTRNCKNKKPQHQHHHS